MRLAAIILAQFLSGSIWFAGNIAYSGQSLLLSAVQLGFIVGSLSFALLNISDRFSPALVFFLSAFSGACFNFSSIFLADFDRLLILSRLLCGISLAGIYPVGMKIAASWYPQTISRALGWMVGALVLATGLPHLINLFDWQHNSRMILYTTSFFCLLGGITQLVLVKDGPHLPKGSPFNLHVVKEIFDHQGFKASSFGYFGHMWELYAVFAFIPVLLSQIPDIDVSLWSFLFFAGGFIGCSAGGTAALRIGSRNVALTALSISGICCLVSPFMLSLPKWAALMIIMIWGFMVVADSPQFSALNTEFAPRKYVGSALTIVNCIGFLITIFTIETTQFWIDHFGIRTAFVTLAAGPVFGWMSLKKYKV